MGINEMGGGMSLSYYFDQSHLESGKVNVIQVLKTCEGFVRSGVDVTLYVPASRATRMCELKEMYGVDADITIRPIIRFPYIKFMLNAVGMFGYLLNDKNPVIITRNFYFAFLATLLDKVVVLEAHQYAFDQFYHTWLFSRVMRLIGRRKNLALVVISGQLEDKLREIGVTAQMLVCHDGFDDRAGHGCGLAAVSREGYRAVAMYAGSFSRIKGLAHIYYLAASNPDVRFYMLGGEDGTEDAELVGRLRRLENVVMAGQVRHPDIHRYLVEADVLLLLPTCQGVYNDVTSPLKMFEYMNTGRAILATGMPSLKEVLIDGHNALVADDDGQDIDRRFKELVEDAGLRDRLGAAAKEDVMAYSWDRRAAKMKEFISERCAGMGEWGWI